MAPGFHSRHGVVKCEFKVPKQIIQLSAGNKKVSSIPAAKYRTWDLGLVLKIFG